MAADPVFAGTPNKGTPGTLTAANLVLDGTGANKALIFTAGSNGSFLPAVLAMHLGTNANAGVLRIFRNNGADPETASNNNIIAEAVFDANTISQTAASVPIFVPLNLSLESGERIYAAISVAAAAGLRVGPINGANI